MAVEDKKYQLGTAENKAFLDASRDNLLNFGTEVPGPDAAPTGWAMTVPRGRTAIALRGSPAE